MTTATPKPIAFIYDRHATTTTTVLDLRLKACEEHAATRGWEIAGCWIDTGDHALTDGHRPELDALLHTMRAAGTAQPRVLLVHDWHRLSRSMDARGLMTRRVLMLGGAWAETCDGETRTVDGRYRQVGRLTSGPVTV